MAQKATGMQLKIVEDGYCDPFRALDYAELLEEREDTICVECRHCDERSHITDDVERRYICRKDPKYEEHINFVDGKQVFFDRPGWENILECRGRNYEWADRKKESEYFHSSQSYGSCMKINTDGRCGDFERLASLTGEIARREPTWMVRAVPLASGVGIGVLLGLLAAAIFF